MSMEWRYHRMSPSGVTIPLSDNNQWSLKGGAKMAMTTIQATAAARRSKDWPRFEARLAETLTKLVEDQFLVVSVKQSNRYVQFSAQGSFGMRVETTSNHYLPRGQKLDRKQMSALKKLGWQVPTANPKQSTPERDPDGSPNFFIDIDSPVDAAAIARLAVTTLVDVLGVAHPGHLEYEAFDAPGGEVELAKLGLKRAVRNQESGGEDAALLKLIREITGITTLKRDEDGDIGVRYGSTLVFARMLDEPRRVHLFSPLVREIAEGVEVQDRINRLNAGSDGIRYFWINGAIYAALDIPADPFSAREVASAYRHFSVVIDDIDDLLQSEFGGQTSFQEWIPSTARH